MIVAGSASPLLLASAGGYNLTNSLRFRSSASASLTRSVAGVNTTQLTFSAWFKLSCNTSNDNTIFATQNNSSNYLLIGFGGDLTLDVQIGGTANRRRTTQVFRDPSAWYHLVVTFDSTQATASDRIKVYVNGSQVTAFGTNTTGMSQNANLPAISSSLTNYIGGYNGSAGYYFDGNMTEINCVYGQALTPSSFGETSTTTGVWQPKKYAGSYGTNGFYLPFTDNSALTTSSNVGLGKDFSGNGNYWTTNNISITAGATYDSMTDVPTLTSATAANYATLSPLNPNGSGYTSQGNLLITGANAYKSTNATIAFPSSGVWYWEGVFVQANNNLGFGCLSIGPNALANPLANTNGIAITSNGFWYLDTSTGTSGHTGWSNSTVVGMKWDSSTNTFSYTVDGTTYNTVGSVSTSDGRQWAPACWAYATNDSVALNFGQRPFTYSIPSGALALNTFNLPTPTIGATASTQANKYFDVTLYTGTGSAQSITNSGGMQPDLVWVKSRSNALFHHLVDSVRGVNRDLFSNSTDAEFNYSSGGSITAFNSNGFSLGTQSSEVNGNGFTFVGWQWRASNTTAVTNTAGSITSTVSANTTAGFSIVTYTGNGTAGATIGHGLGVTPSMVILKQRSLSGNNWQTYHSAIGNTKALFLNTTDSVATNSVYWNNTSPTSTVFSIGTSANANQNTTTYVAYCFSAVAGYSAFGSYVGNRSSTAGPFVFCGFRPRYVMVKCTSAAGQNWVVWDTSRSPFNLSTAVLYPNGADAEGTATVDNIDIVSNGFRSLGSSGGSSNNNGATYIFMAFAESPFKYANAR